jgi:protein SCO1/2
MKPGEPLPSRLLWGFLVLVILGIAGAFVASRYGAGARAASLPVLGAVPDFSLTERSGRIVTRADLEGRVSVVDFIFTSCSAQCPRVSAEMAKLQQIALPRWPQVRLISLTVDPERDTPGVLAEYARGFSADRDRWWFLTGPAGKLDSLIRDGFRVAGASKERVDTSPGAILHSVSLVLVDPRGRIRGYYESTDPEEMAKLRGDLAALAAGGHSAFSFRTLPHLNAFLNAVSFLCLVSGYLMIRGKRVAAHRACMLSACGASVLFFISYITYHLRVGSVRFPGEGWVRPAYFTLLISHTLLAATVPFLAGVTLVRALRGDFPAHRRLARWTFPVWAYVSLTGVLVYVMLYWAYGAGG